MIATIVHCYVGCNTGSPDKQALHVLECDTETGAAKIVQSVKGVEGTTYFQIDKDGKFLYSVIGEKRDTKSTSAAVRFPIDGWKLGEMERLCELPCEAPCHVSLTPDGKRVAFAAYLSATCGTVGVDDVATASSRSNMDRPTAGTPSLRTYVFPDDAMGSNGKRQKKAYAHQTFHVAGLPGCKVAGLGVVDLGCDRIWFFDPETMERMPCEIKFDPGDGPRHAIFSKDGRFLFVLCELGSCVYAFRREGSRGSGVSPLRNKDAADSIQSGGTPLPRFERVGKWSMLPEGYNRWEADGETLNTKAAAIKLTADGEILMASNRGYDSIAFYAVGEDGKLTLKNIARLRGKFPRDFELMPGGKFMVVGHKMSDEIQVYRFDRAACTLEPVGDPIAAWRPLCFKFAAK